ncbi:MAG: EVE domain-containing protein [Hyphomicrobiales bacterium]|nr:EVE domain-containing protein [Hyphomicrobiales bacterium]
MAFWLFKSEPGTWSWQDQIHAGATGTEWDGVRNYQARNNMDKMKLGDLGFFYHSVKEKTIVGITSVIAEAHMDTTTDNKTWRCVDLAYHKSFKNPVSLEEIKNKPKLSEMILVKNSRLSVQPVKNDEWNIICNMGDPQ